jgi:MFS family permease
LLGSEGMFVLAAIFVGIALVFQFNVKETLVNKKRFSLSLMIPTWENSFEKKVFPAAIVMILTSVCSGIIFVLVPDICDFLMIENKGWFFLFYVVTTILIRFFAGRFSDVKGRVVALKWGVVSLGFAMFLLMVSVNQVIFTVSSIVFGIATGIISPALYAWSADLSPIHRKGIGTGTLFIALEIGIMLGSFMTLLTYSNTLTSANFSFATGLVCAIGSFLFLRKY